jgi:hypothetical protein
LEKWGGEVPIMNKIIDSESGKEEVSSSQGTDSGFGENHSMDVILIGTIYKLMPARCTVI